LDASDHVLYEPGRSTSNQLLSLSADFQSELRRIYESARSIEQIEAELARLNASLTAQRAEVEATHRRTTGLIESRFDAAVRQTFRHIADELPGHLDALDRDLERLLCDYLESQGMLYQKNAHDAGGSLDIAADPRLPEPFHEGVRVALGGGHGLVQGEPLHVGHPLVRVAAEAARQLTGEVFRVRLGQDDPSPQIAALRGRRGRLKVVKLRYPGFEPVDRLLPVVVLENAAGALDSRLTLRLLEGPLEDVALLASNVSDAELEEAVEEALFLDEREVSTLEHRLFERAIGQLERFIEDRVLIVKRSREDLLRRMRAGRRDRTAATGAEARTRAEDVLERSQRELEALDLELVRLQSRDDDGYRRWRQHAYQRRYAPPGREAILEAEFVIG
jgi:hypothetical protein